MTGCGIHQGFWRCTMHDNAKARRKGPERNIGTLPMSRRASGIGRRACLRTKTQDIADYAAVLVSDQMHTKSRHRWPVYASKLGRYCIWYCTLHLTVAKC